MKKLLSIVVCAVLLASSAAFAESTPQKTDVASLIGGSTQMSSAVGETSPNIVLALLSPKGTAAYWANICMFPTGVWCYLVVPMQNGLSCCCSNYGCGGWAQ